MQGFPLYSATSLNDVTTHWPTEKDVIHMLFDEGLLKREVYCDKCTRLMTLRTRGDGYQWRCRESKSKDCSSKSVKDGSFFASTKLNLTQAIKIFVMWNQQYSSKQISAETEVSQNTVCDWRNFLRGICVKIEEGYGQIGGHKHIVEIDETNIHSRKFGVGRSVNDDWVLGGLDRTTGRVFATRVPNRTAPILVPLLQNRVDKKSTVYSDEWKSYSQLKRYFAAHYTVKHKTQFVNLVGSHKVCTNGIESFWARLKKPFKQGNGTSSALLDSYISEYVVRENEKTHFFRRIIETIRLE